MFGLNDTAIRIIGGGLIVLAIFGYGYYRGHHAVTLQFDQYKAEVAAAADQQTKKAQEIDAKNQKLFQETKNAYNTQLANLRAYYGMRLAKGSSTVPGTSGTTPGIIGKTEYDLPALPPITTLAAQCAETTLTLVQLQRWVENAQ